MSWTFALTEQPSLFGQGVARLRRTFSGLRRIALGRGAWVDHLPAWVQGHEALFEALWTTTRWRAERREMYERMVDVPRLVATLPDDGPGHPVVAEMADGALRPLRPTLARDLACRLPGRARQRGVSWRPHRAAGRGIPWWPSSRLGRRGASCCGRPAAGRRVRSISAGATSWSWAARASGRGSTAVPKMASAKPRMSVQFRPEVPDGPA